MPKWFNIYSTVDAKNHLHAQMALHTVQRGTNAESLTSMPQMAQHTC